MRFPGRLTATAALVAAALTITACTPTVSVDAAPDANNPRCADVTVRLPSQLAGQDRRWTDAQATGAWGSPTSIIIRCGVPVPGPTTLPCQEFGAVDWIVDDAEAPFYRITSFGTDPAVEVYLNSEVVASADILDVLARIVVDTLPSNGLACIERPSEG